MGFSIFPLFQCASLLAHTLRPHCHPQRRALFALTGAPGSFSATPSSTDALVAALAFDLETTGLCVRTCEIVQFAVVCTNSQQQPQPAFARLVLPERDVDPGAAAVHGHTRDSLLAAGAQPFPLVWAECEAWLSATFGPHRPLVWCAHNGQRFDAPILSRHLAETTPFLPSLLPPRGHLIDSLALARHALAARRGPGSHTLGRLYADATGERLAGAHDALADAAALGVVWRWLVEERGADHRVDEASTLSLFQQHLQLCVQAAAQPNLGACPPWGSPNRSAPPSTAVAALRRESNKLPATVASVKRSTSAANASATDVDRLTALPGVGSFTARRLRKKGITSEEDLLLKLKQVGGDPARLRGWLIKALPGAHPASLSKLVAHVEHRAVSEVEW
mmetsp:Transcript_41963/g.89584  ORF Transcript_41963/g.89584 Transcript_41963/m.89584 type:complete len:393 (-) Transcript_41963:272-1450(-)|eukprot:CAMPEP_0183337426 /NCGR_PEP_ID=MMETSP0164_2-20130417/5070_1 /TAXON_ID=221442 /ORGANISM="Coccolithus pelagicus ssp braarudi, Strain PLY182g" /LENGTH=392 /DNA_ID=CAMNT_0025507105 /DNA_START=100 /DNA_END=1278 /DNA_ORIENTATION=+